MYDVKRLALAINAKIAEMGGEFDALFCGWRAYDVLAEWMHSTAGPVTPTSSRDEQEWAYGPAQLRWLGRQVVRSESLPKDEVRVVQLRDEWRVNVEV